MDICLQEKPISSSDLIITMSKALKEFLARFDYVKTLAATLCRLFNESPNDGECMSSCASRFLSTLMNQWHTLSTKQIVITYIN
ncbi:unnamed protein product [Spodoptera exigua]|nr:unnamed protein product [Spodoptera exigua]